MIPYKNRFHGHASLRYVYKNGETSRGQYFHLRYSVNPRRRTPRIAIVVSKKVHKGAVGRNRIRRRLYELFRQRLPEFNGGVDIVCIVTQQQVRMVVSEELSTALDSILLEAGLCNKERKNDTIKSKGII